MSQQPILDSLTTSLRSYLSCACSHLDGAIRTVQTYFNSFAESIDFALFCVVYCLLLIWCLRRLNRVEMFHPQNKELVDWKSSIQKKLSSFVVSLPIIKQMVRRKFDKGIQEMEVEVEKEFEKLRDPHRSRKLPQEGMKKENLESRIHKWAEIETKNMSGGRLSGTFYPDNQQHCRDTSQFASKYMYQNPLHLDTYKELSKMEAELLKMTGSLISKNQVYGIITSGGSESLIMSLYAYKNYGQKAKPNIVVPNTIHAAIDKGAMYFNIEVRKARLNQFYEVDVDHMEKLIDSNTIALYGSYPNYPHGIIDPIQDIASLALKYKVPFHVDACLGGLVTAFLPEHKEKFGLDINGITSISLDHHKYGLAPKGVATIFFKTAELRHSMYFFYTDWVGGIYGTPSFVGSRSGFASAGAWYSLTHVGRNQFKANATLVAEATKKAASQLRKIKGVTVFGNPELCVVAFDITVVNVFAVCSYLEKNKGWHLSAIHKPKGMHVSVTPANAENVRDNLAKDVREAIENLEKAEVVESTTAAFYGANAKLPNLQLGNEMMKAFMKVWFK